MEYTFKLVEPVKDGLKELTKLNNIKNAIFLARAMSKRRLY